MVNLTRQGTRAINSNQMLQMGSIVTHEEPEEEGMCLAIKIGMHTAVYDMPYDLTFNSRHLG